MPFQLVHKTSHLLYYQSYASLKTGTLFGITLHMYFINFNTFASGWQARGYHINKLKLRLC